MEDKDLGDRTFNFAVRVINPHFKESRESNYWLRIIKASELSGGDELEYLINESFELKNIFSSILKKIHYRNDVQKKE